MLLANFANRLDPHQDRQNVGPDLDPNRLKTSQISVTVLYHPIIMIFSGYINDGQESYHIEPAYDISSTTHRLFKDSDSLRKNFRCGAHPHGHSNKINETHQILHRNEILHRVCTSE